LIIFVIKKAMATVIINTRSKAARVMVEYLKTQTYAKIVEEPEPNSTTLRAIKEAKTGKTTTYKDTKELTEKLRKLSNV
jgi:hypothetical protein